MRVKVVRGVSLGGGRDVYPPEIIELDEHHARRLIAIGFVVPAPEAPAPPAAAGTEAKTLAANEIVDREPEPENREPRRSRGKEE